MKVLEIELGSDRFKVFADVVGEYLWVHAEGQTFKIALKETTKRRRGESEAAAGGEVKAPMPGKITQILVKASQPVTKGQVVAVMEAMKMEYNLKSAVQGVVESVNAQVGAQVQLGQLLVQIKEEA